MLQSQYFYCAATSNCNIETLEAVEAYYIELDTVALQENVGET